MSVTADQYFELTDAKYRRAELAGGQVVFRGRRERRHARISCVLATILEEHGLPADVAGNARLSETTVLGPDVYVTSSDTDGLEQRPEDLLLVVEVMSEQDGGEYGQKMAEYAAAGIPQYWIVDWMQSGRPFLLAFSLTEEGTYGDRRYFSEEVDVTIAGTRVRFDLSKIELPQPVD